MNVLGEAFDRGIDGAERAGKHADEAMPRWRDDANLIVWAYAQTHKQFMAEDARAYAESVGLPPPPDKRAWGIVFKALSKLGLLFNLGYGPTKSSNGSPKVIWGRLRELR